MPTTILVRQDSVPDGPFDPAARAQQSSPAASATAREQPPMREVFESAHRFLELVQPLAEVHAQFSGSKYINIVAIAV